MFESMLQRIERDLDIPYPKRRQVIRELESDLLSHYTALCDRGYSASEAKQETLRGLGLDDEALASLQAVHNPVIRRILLRLPQPAREPTEWLCAGFPLLAAIYILILEVPMLEFLRQGGSAMWLILFISGAGLFLQMRRGFSWFVTGDHSARALGRNTPTPLYLAGATFLMSVMATGLNFYVVLSAWSLGKLSQSQLATGLTESLATIIVGGALATLIVLLQGALQAGLRSLQVKPIE